MKANKPKGDISPVELLESMPEDIESTVGGCFTCRHSKWKKGVHDLIEHAAKNRPLWSLSALHKDVLRPWGYTPSRQALIRHLEADEPELWEKWNDRFSSR